MRLHMLGLFYAILSQDASPCPFTGKVLRFPKMMKDEGFDYIEYAVEGSESEAKHKVPILSRDTFVELRRLHDEKEAPGQRSGTDTSLFREFDKNLEAALRERVQPSDIICHPYGGIHSRLLEIFPDCYHIETGIGYTGVFAPYKIFETYAWWHWHQGRDNRAGHNYEWVIPNYYDLSEWEPSYTPGEYILFFGRIVPDKGLDIVRDIAKMTNREVIICGEGDASRWLSPDVPNLKAIPPVRGKARSEFLRNAYCLVMPTTYTEPFGGSGVEGMLCGTPLISADFGGFSETVQHGLSGFRCKTLGDWMHAIKLAGSLDRKAIAEYARAKYSMETIAPQFTRVFDQLYEMKNQGWYCRKPFMAIPPR